jgi:hypothetical protein
MAGPVTEERLATTNQSVVVVVNTPATQYVVRGVVLSEKKTVCVKE